MALVPGPAISYSFVRRCAVKPLPLCLCLLMLFLLPSGLHASVYAYIWIQCDEYPEQIDVYGATYISGSYQEQYYYDFAIYGVLYANGQMVDSGYEGWSCEGATAVVSVAGQYGTSYEFLGFCDLKIYFNDICYPWWYDLGYYWYVSNPLYSPDAGIWEPFDPICLDDMVLPGIGTVYAILHIPGVEITSADIPNDHISVFLSPPGLTGTLTLQLISPGQHTILNNVSRNSGLHNETFDIPNLTVGEYNYVRAVWSISGASATANYSYHIKVLGEYNHTRYNTPTESYCPGTDVPFKYNNNNACGAINCQNVAWTSAVGKSLWIDEVEENGSGYHGTVGPVSKEWRCQEPDPKTGHAFRRVPQPCPSCGGTLIVGESVARNASNEDLPCNARVYVHGVGVVTVVDAGGGLALNQLDHYSGFSGCNREGGPIGPKMTIRLY